MPEVRGYETTTKLLAARDSATASRDTTGTLMDLLHQATDLSNNALSGQKASDIVTKLLDLLPAFNRAIPIVPNTMTYADIFLRKHILSVLQHFAGHDTTHKITFGKFLKDAESLFHDGSVNGLIADLQKCLQRHSFPTVSFSRLNSDFIELFWCIFIVITH